MNTFRNYEFGENHLMNVTLV